MPPVGGAARLRPTFGAAMRTTLIVSAESTGGPRRITLNHDLAHRKIRSPQPSCCVRRPRLCLFASQLWRQLGPSGPAGRRASGLRSVMSNVVRMHLRSDRRGARVYFGLHVVAIVANDRLSRDDGSPRNVRERKDVRRLQGRCLQDRTRHVDGGMQRRRRSAGERRSRQRR